MSGNGVDSDLTAAISSTTETTGEMQNLHTDSQVSTKTTNLPGGSGQQSMGDGPRIDPVTGISTEPEANGFVNEYNDAYEYVDLVKLSLGARSGAYKRFLAISKEFRHKEISRLELFTGLGDLFSNYPQLLAGLNDFLPNGHVIQQQDGQRILFRDNQAPVVLTLPRPTRRGSDQPSTSTIVFHAPPIDPLESFGPEE